MIRFPVPLRPVLAAALTIGLLVAGARPAPASAQDRAGIRYREIPEEAWSVVAEVRARPGKADALREATLPLVAQVRSDPANLVYFLQEDRDVPGRFVFYEIFASRADFEAHNAMPYVRAWFDRLPELAEGGVTMTQMRVLGHAGR